MDVGAERLDHAVRGPLDEPLRLGLEDRRVEDVEDPLDDEVLERLRDDRDPSTAVIHRPRRADVAADVIDPRPSPQRLATQATAQQAAREEVPSGVLTARPACRIAEAGAETIDRRALHDRRPDGSSRRCARRRTSS
jgi:hypothetical protein